MSPLVAATWRRGTLVAAAVLLVACTSMVPDYQRPVAPVPARFPFDPAGASGVAAAEIDWQAFFRDERLKRYIDLALQNNRDLRVAVLNIEQARAQMQLNRANESPTVNAGVSGTRQPAANGRSSTLVTAGLLVTNYELDLFGRLRALSESAQAQLLASVEARKTVQISLISQVANTYLSLLADDELLRVARDTLVSRQESQRLTRLRFDQGASSEIDFRLSESLAEGARVALAQATRQRALDQNALNLLVGQSLTAEVAGTLPEALPLTGQNLLGDLPAGIASEVLARRPDVREAEQRLLAANANIGAARAAFFPRISLTGSVGTASSQLSGLFGVGSLAWSFAPQLLLPIFDAGRNQANLDASKVVREIATAQYEKAVQSAFREVADALALRSTLAEQLRAQAAQTNAESVRLRLTDLRYRNGAASYFEVLDAQRSMFAAQQSVVQLQLLQAQNLVNLYKVLGGGWKDANQP